MTAECEAIIRALEAVDGNKFHAARLLGVSRSTLYRKIEQYQDLIPTKLSHLHE